MKRAMIALALVLAGLFLVFPYVGDPPHVGGLVGLLFVFLSAVAIWWEPPPEHPDGPLWECSFCDKPVRYARCSSCFRPGDRLNRIVCCDACRDALYNGSVTGFMRAQGLAG